MKYKAVLFDLDGTLINTLDDLTDVMNTTLAEFGGSAMTPQQCRPLLGVGLRYWVENALPKDKHEFIEPLMTKFRALYNDNCLNKSAPYDGIMELTDKLAELGLKQAVVTNKNEDVSLVMIKKVFGEEKFPIIRGAVNGIGCKPDPQIVFDVLDEFGVKPEETLFVGDGEADLDVAKNSGATSVWVSWGFRNPDELEGRKPDHTVNHPLEIIDLIK